VLLPLILPGIITGVALLSCSFSVSASSDSVIRLAGGDRSRGSADVICVTQVLLDCSASTLEEAVAICTPTSGRLWHVTLPTIRSAVLGAALLVFAQPDEIA
jgi:ABC-type spermidine/putrescine transport system permease subunit II